MPSKREPEKILPSLIAFVGYFATEARKVVNARNWYQEQGYCCDKHNHMGLCAFGTNLLEECKKFGAPG